MTTLSNLPDKGRSNVIELSHHPRARKQPPRIVRLAPELDGLEMLYSNDTASGRLFSLKILFWALRENGDVVGMVPWLKGLTACTELKDPLNGHWEGYYDSAINRVFYDAPQHKRVELEAAAEYFDYDDCIAEDILQELPDTLGTHAVLTHNGFRSFLLIEVASWRLYGDGRIDGMLIDEQKMKDTPVLPGDPCLYPASVNPFFKYYFQHRIANKIKSNDPETLAAMYSLIDR